MEGWQCVAFPLFLFHSGKNSLALQITLLVRKVAESLHFSLTSSAKCPRSFIFTVLQSRWKQPAAYWNISSLAAVTPTETNICENNNAFYLPKHNYYLKDFTDLLEIVRDRDMEKPLLLAVCFVLVISFPWSPPSCSLMLSTFKAQLQAGSIGRIRCSRTPIMKS